MKRIVRFLRSRRIAALLIVAFGAASLLGTWKDGPGEKVFVSAPFLILTAWLAASTGVCAWDRTVRAARLARLPLDAGAGAGRMLGQYVLVPRRGGDVLDAAAGELRRRRFRVSRADGRLVAEKGRWAVWGSPVFHWALVALVLVVAASRLTRYEGQVGVPVGQSVSDRAESYGQLSKAPFAMPFTGLDVAVLEMDEEFEASGVEFGPTPKVRIDRDGSALGEGFVRPNDPLRAGGLLVHSSGHGLAVHLVVTDAAGVPAATSTVLIDFDHDADSGATAAPVTITGADGVPVEVMLTMDARDSSGAVPERLPPPKYRRLSVWGSTLASGVAELGLGERVEVAPGAFLGLVDAGYYARLRFVSDWGPGWMYALLAIASVSLAIALLVPFRVISAGIDDTGSRLDVRFRDTSGSALLRDDIAAVFERSCDKSDEIVE